MKKIHSLEQLVESPPEFIIFDYDRTIATVPINWMKQRREFRDYLTRLGADVEKMTSVRVDELEREAIEVLGMDWESVMTFRQYIESEVNGLHEPKPSVCRALKELKASSATLSILSNNLQQTVRGGLEELGLSEIFECVLGVDDTRDPKPGITGLELLKQRVALVPGRSVLVGDSPQTDGLFCERVGIPFLLVPS